MLCNNAQSETCIDVLGGDASAMLDAILQSSMDCVKVISLDGVLSYMSENGQAVMEIADVSDILGAKWSALWPSTHTATVDDAVAKAALGQSVRFEALCPTAEGREAWWDVTVSPIYDAQGGPIAILSVSREITHRVRIEKELLEREAELTRLYMRQQAASA